MTQSTEQERADFDRLILETDGMKDTGIGWADRNPDGTYKHKQIQKHFLTWQAARRAQVVHVNLSQADSEKMIELVQSGNYQIVQDDAAPVQMPEPRGYVWLNTHHYRQKLKCSHIKQDWAPVYTERQVRQLLADHGVK